MSSFSKKTVLITGATGMIGSHIVDALIQMQDVKVIALGRSKQKLLEGFKEYLMNPNFTYMVQDVSNPFYITNERIDFILHAAGSVEGETIANMPVDVIAPNVNGTINCLELLREQEERTGIRGRFVFFSSVTVYGNLGDGNRVVSEKDTEITEPLNGSRAAYSQSKRMAEVLVQAYRKQYGVDAVIARFSTVYGNTRFKQKTAFFEFILKAVEGENIILNSSGLPKRDNIYIDDAVEGLLLVSQKGIDGEAYNISSNAEMGNFVAIDEIAEIIATVVNKNYGHLLKHNVKVIYQFEKSKARKAGIVVDNSKLKSLGWLLRTSIMQGITDTIERIVI